MMKMYLTTEDKLNRILDQVLVFQGYFPLWSLIFILFSNIMHTKEEFNTLLDFGFLNNMIAELVVLTLIAILMHTYSAGVKTKPSYANDIKQPILITKILCVGVPVILANLLMMLTTKYIGYPSLINTFYKYFTFWILGSIITAWIDFKPVITTAQRIAKKLNLY